MSCAKISYKIRVDELNGTVKELLNLFKDSALENCPDLDVMIEELKKLSAKLNTAISKDRVLSELSDLDDERDQCIRNIDVTIRSALVIPVTDIRANAQVLHAIFSKYGNKMINLNHASKSSQISSMLEDFSGKTVEIKSISYMNGMVEALKEAQDNFEAKEKSYNESTKAIKDADSASGLKPAVINVINNKIVPYMNAVAEWKGDDFNKLLVASDNVLSSMNRVAENRRNAKAAEERLKRSKDADWEDETPS